MSTTEEPLEEMPAPGDEEEASEESSEELLEESEQPAEESPAEEEAPSGASIPADERQTVYPAVTRELDAPPPAMPARDLEMDRLARLGMWLAASEAEHPTPNQLGAAAALRIYLARELGLPITAASELSFIRGRLNVGAHLQRYLAWEAGIRVVKGDSSDEAVTAILIDRHTGEELGRSTFTKSRRHADVEA